MRGVLAFVTLGALFAIEPVHEVRADDAGSPLRATATCEAPVAAGRFHCDVELRVSGGSISWADVEVVTVADFILPLRGRASPREAATHEADIYRWALGFVAKAQGKGDVTFRVRAVVCRGETCAPSEALAVATVVVGR